MSTSLSDILTSIKNLVSGVGTLTTDYMNVEGQQNFAGVTAPTVIKATSGRIARISVVVGGSASGTVYDSAVLGGITRPLSTIPTTVGIYEVNFPVSYGILVVPGSGQTISGVYS
jgi:hypothetical protein